MEVHRHGVLVVLPTAGQACSTRRAHRRANERMSESNARSGHRVKVWREYRQVCAARVVRVVVQATPVIPAPSIDERIDYTTWRAPTNRLAVSAETATTAETATNRRTECFCITYRSSSGKNSSTFGLPGAAALHLVIIPLSSSHAIIGFEMPPRGH